MADDRDSRDALAASCELPSGTPEYTTDWLGYGLQSSSSEYPPHHSQPLNNIAAPVGGLDGKNRRLRTYW